MNVGPHILRWANPTSRKDGTPYGQVDHAGYQVSFDGAPAVALPLTWGTSFDLSSLPQYQALTPGEHTATLTPLAKDGSAGPASSVTFRVIAPPNGVGGLAIS